MNRRKFLRRTSGLLVPASLAFPAIVRAQFFPVTDLPFLAKASAGGCSSSVINAWAAQVVTNGGAAPSAAVKSALCTFWNGMVAAGLDSTMVYVLVMVGGDLISASTPIVNTASANNPAVNHNFISGDVGANGVTGNASTKYFDTGHQFSSAFASAQNCGWSLYDYNATATGFTNGNYGSGATDCFMGAAHHSDGNSYSYIGNVSSNVIAVASSGNGMYGGNRVSSTDHRLFFFNSGHAAAQIGATDSTSFTGSLPGYNNISPVFAVWNQAGGLQLLCSDTISYHSLHTGHSLANFTTESGLVQTMLTSLGGGFR